MERIAEQDTTAQLLGLPVCLLCGCTASKQKSPVNFGIRIGYLLALDLIAEVGEKPPLHDTQHFIAAHWFADCIEALHEFSQDAQQLQVSACLLLACLERIDHGSVRRGSYNFRQPLQKGDRLPSKCGLANNHPQCILDVEQYFIK